ncbi:MAG: ASCH domain-containing protein [Acholeplasmatales bacterium]|nr:ASCH domain-containing protein [Acholeplasmatales bacterium]
MKLLLYCTKAKPYLFNQNIYEFYDSKYITSTHKFHEKQDYLLNGTIVAECDFDVEDFDYINPECLTHTYLDLLKKSCLTDKQMYDYLKGKNGKAIHIKNLHIFDKSKELSDYYTFNGIVNNVNNWKPVDKAPQNMMYAYDLISELGFSGTYNRYLKKNILISIKPEWLCKILNGEKTIEVRKKILKEMLKDELPF